MIMRNKMVEDKVCIVSAPSIYEPYDLVGRIGKIIRADITLNKIVYGIKLDCGLINAGRDDGLFYLNKNDFCVIFPPQKPSSLTNDITYANLKEEEESKNMAALTGFKAVAVIEQGTGCYKKDYHYAIYDDGTTYMPGDKVYVSGTSNTCILKIKEIITPKEAADRCKKNITAEIICRVDTNAYDARVEQRKEAAALKKEMDKMIKQMDETKKYDMYAAENPELKEMLDRYKELRGEKYE